MLRDCTFLRNLNIFPISLKFLISNRILISAFEFRLKNSNTFTVSSFLSTYPFSLDSSFETPFLSNASLDELSL